MLVAKDFLSQLYRLLRERLGQVVLTLVVKHKGKVIHTRESIKVLFTEDFLSKILHLYKQSLGLYLTSIAIQIISDLLY